MAAEKLEMKKNQLMPPHACCEFFAVHELRAVKPLALGWMSNMTLVFSVHIPLCMSTSESCRMNPQQLEVHDLPSNTSAASGSPHGNLLMSALSLPSISVSLPLCHICKGENAWPRGLTQSYPVLFHPRRLGTLALTPRNKWPFMGM